MTNRENFDLVKAAVKISEEYRKREKFDTVKAAVKISEEKTRKLLEKRIKREAFKILKDAVKITEEKTKKLVEKTAVTRFARRGERGEPGQPGPVGAPGPQGEPGKTPDQRTLEVLVREKLAQEFEVYRQQLFSRLNQAINSIAWSGSGGGSVNILDNDDVVFKQLSQVAPNSILVFNPTIRKFEAINIADVINDIKTELELKFTKLIDDVTPLLYIGEANPGSNTADAVWRIQRVDKTNDPDLEIKWANGTAAFDKVWDNRAGYSYS